MRTGDRWARMKCVDIVKREKRVEFFEGGGNSWDVWTIVAECDCGTRTEYEEKGFRKKEHRDCGCGLASGDERKIVISITVPVRLIDRVQAYARESTNGNISAAITDLVRNALDRNALESTEANANDTNANKSNWNENEVNKHATR